MLAGVSSAAFIAVTTALRSACDWLCCTSGNGDNSNNWSRSRSSCYSVYEVADNTVNAGGNNHLFLIQPNERKLFLARSPNVAIKNGRKISPINAIPNIEHVVVRQKDKKRLKQKIDGTPLNTSKKNSCPASVYSVEKVQKPSIASIRSYRIGRRLSDTIALSPKCSFSDLRQIDSVEILTEFNDDEEVVREAVRNILGWFLELLKLEIEKSFVFIVQENKFSLL